MPSPYRVKLVTASSKRRKPSDKLFQNRADELLPGFLCPNQLGQVSKCNLNKEFNGLVKQVDASTVERLVWSEAVNKESVN